MKSFILIFLIGLTCGCQQVEGIDCFPSPDCIMPAIIRQTQMASPCDIAFELEDGSLIIPERRQYVQLPTPQEDPIYYAKLVPGTRVKIGGRLSAQPCVSGRVFFITCIESIQQPVL